MEATGRIHDALDAIAPDARVIRPLPGTPAAASACALDMVRSLFAQGCEHYRVCVEAARGLIVAEGWEEKPLLVAAYEPPPAVVAQSGLAADLTPMDRARLRNIVRKTHRWCWREEPTDAMCDELIDAIGSRVAEKIVKDQVDAGRI